MPEERTPVLRHRTPAEELKDLHPIERFLYRLFETLASIKLAICLMIWLMIEGTLGSYLEAQINPSGANYFVYGNIRFHILLAMLGLNILCAALIRFPWKLYQTGFLITHIGLLILLGGAFWTFLGHTDALLQVAEGTMNDVMFDPDQDVFAIQSHGRTGEVENESIRVRLGPVSWGAKLLGRFAWRKDYVEEHQLKNGDLLRIKEFYAHSEFTETLVPSELGTTKLLFALADGSRSPEARVISIDRTRGVGTTEIAALPGMPKTPGYYFEVSTDEELDHFVKAAPDLRRASDDGMLAYSHKGKHYSFDVANLRKSSVAVPGTNITLRVDPKPSNPKTDAEKMQATFLVNAELTQEGKTKKFTVGPFGIVGEGQVVSSPGIEHLFTYFPILGGNSTSFQFASNPKGKVAYRVYGSDGAKRESCYVEEMKEYPLFPMMNLKFIKQMSNADRAFVINPRKLPKGQPGQRSVVIEYLSNGMSFTANLPRSGIVRRLMGEKIIEITYAVDQTKLPFKVRLDKLEQPFNPGTNQPAMFTSQVTVFENRRGREIQRKELVTMNEPLEYSDSNGQSFTLYQSGSDIENKRSTFTVARDPGLVTKYVGAVVLCIGIITMFYFGGYFKKRPQKQQASVIAAPQKQNTKKQVAVAGAK